MKNWCNESWDRVSSILTEIKAQPFLSELQQGNLDKEKFVFYMHQDAYYLNAYGKILCGIANRLEDLEESKDFIGFASGTVAVEQALHATFIASFGDEKIPAKSPTCIMYTGFLAETLAHQPIEVALAAVLPCFWIYQDVGDYMLSLPQIENNPYQAWIDTYGGEDFANSVRRAKEITEKYASKASSEIREQMHLAFYKTSQMEWMFWDSAYRLEKWPVG